MDVTQLIGLLSNSMQSEFIRMMAIFTLAALVHARQVRAEIRMQLEGLTAVLREDMAQTRQVLDRLGERVTKIEEQLKPK